MAARRPRSRRRVADRAGRHRRHARPPHRAFGAPRRRGGDRGPDRGRRGGVGARSGGGRALVRGRAAAGRRTRLGRRLALLAPRARALAACGRYDDSLPISIRSSACFRRTTRRCGPGDRFGGEGQAAPRPPRRGASGARSGPRGARRPGSPDATALKLELAADSFFTGDQEGFEHWVSAALRTRPAVGMARRPPRRPACTPPPSTCATTSIPPARHSRRRWC